MTRPLGGSATDAAVPAVANNAGVTHHALPPHEVLLLLETDATTGLTDDQAQRRLQRFGANALPQPARRSWPRRLADQLNNPLIYVLLVSGVVTMLLREVADSIVIFAVVVVNAAIGFVQESKAQASLDALRALVHTQARVRRAGEQRTVPSEELVPGDVVVVEAGDKVPADIRLLVGAELAVDESALTGESVPVVKNEGALPLTTPVSDRLNMLYSGTLVTSGTGTGVVVATGASTELGEIHRLVGTADSLDTPLTQKLAHFSKLLTVAILLLAGLAFAVGVWRGEGPAQMFTAAVALAVGAIPEGLPAAVTITLAIGVSRMARRRAVIRRLPAVETLGSTTVVCTDKTGTLTQNRMTVSQVWTPDGAYSLARSGSRGGVVRADGTSVDVAADVDGLDAGAGAAVRWTLLCGALCNDARLRNSPGDAPIGDPTELALLTSAATAGLSADTLRRQWPRLDVLPFSSQRQLMATLHADVDRTGSVHERTAHDTEGPGDAVLLVKGAAERVIPLCTSQLRADGTVVLLAADDALAASEQLAEGGLRVLAMARREVGPHRGADIVGLIEQLTFVGLQAMLDPPRPEATAAVRSCQTAGIEVKMVTGDHAATATSIAEQMGILTSRDDDAVLTGAQLAALPEDDYDDAVTRAKVLARVSPEQKLRLVQGLQDRKHVVAMTGDGVNDAPALQQADIGVAMGHGGTEVAKEAADMVLTDDDFATIKAAVEEGRGVFDNLTKFIVWTLPTNMGEGLVILVAILLGSALPILPVQILWINMTTAVALGLMLAFEPKEPGLMTRRPRDPTRPLLTGELVLRVLLVSALLVGSSWWLFAWEQGSGATLATARTAALNLFVVVEMFYLFSCRSLTRPSWRIGWFSNRWIWVGVGAQVVGQLALTYLPVMNTVFGTKPIGPEVWLRILLLGALASVVVSIDKYVRARWMLNVAANDS